VYTNDGDMSPISIENMYQNATLFGVNGDIDKANKATDHLTAYAKIEAKALNDLVFFPYVRTVVDGYEISRVAPFSVSSIRSSSIRVATGGQLFNKEISAKNYYQQKYIMYQLRGQNFP
jgi:hypothetical protein